MKISMKWRILAWVLTIMMVVSYTPQIAFATDTAVEPTTVVEETHEHAEGEVCEQEHEGEAPTTASEEATEADAGATDKVKDLIDIFTFKQIFIQVFNKLEPIALLDSTVIYQLHIPGLNEIIVFHIKLRICEVQPSSKINKVLV